MERGASFHLWWNCLPLWPAEIQACLGWCQCSGTGSERLSTVRLIGHRAVNCLRRAFTCCAEEDGVADTQKPSVQSSLPSLEINFFPSSSSKELKWNLPLVFQIFCSRCSSHSAPLPRYGQMKPVRVCTHCYMFHVTPFYSDKAGIWRIKLLVCLLESYTDWYIWPKPRINLKEGPREGM